MPNIDFVLPHWLYWIGIFAFPIIAMILARRTISNSSNYKINIAYFIWLVGGFIGLHRFYVKNLWGVVFCILFGFILYASNTQNTARIIYSDAVANFEASEASIARNEKNVINNDLKIEKQQEKLNNIDATHSSYKRNEKTLDKLVKKQQGIKARIQAAKQDLITYKKTAEDTKIYQEKWEKYSLYAFFAIVFFMIIDLFLLPKMVRQANKQLQQNPSENDVGRPELTDDAKYIAPEHGIAQYIDKLSYYSGEYVAYWGIIAVFVYYYEVTVRYVFNSPTNWAHEAMFLMFGMQYLIAGSYAYLTNSHVRVDIFYAKFSSRNKAIVDIITSVFFFIFAGTLLVAGYIFALDSFQQNEVSFTEWGIQYWPIKFGLVVGAVLLLLQGISKLLKDIMIVCQKGA
jgi:TRAP-type mannitol/chloroaromatic compound transport system permease small subunit